MNKIEVNHAVGDVHRISIGNFDYKVTLSDDYWQKLTGGAIPKEELVKRSFDFLLEREGPESILKEFDLPLIGKYFPEYEKTVKIS